MSQYQELDQIAISVKSHKILKQILKENPHLNEILNNSKNETEALIGVKNWVLERLKKKPDTMDFYTRKLTGRKAFLGLSWRDYAAIRILDYVDNAGVEFADLNLRGAIAISNPIKMLWMAVNSGTGGAKPEFFEDMLHLFRQYSGEFKRQLPSRELVEEWMDRYPSGLDPRIIQLREENKERILKIIIAKINEGALKDPIYNFEKEISEDQKYLKANEWWNEYRFHLKFSIRSPDLLNEMLGYSLDPDTMKVLKDAEEAGIPFFVNPYYLSLLHVRAPYFAIGADLAIRHYILYSKELVSEFGHIVAWEKEDTVEAGKPNAAGWLLPSDHNLHRRYPDVAIMIPDTVGRACGGLCSSCQRMFSFQKGDLNFNLKKLEPKEGWNKKLTKLMHYFEYDSQLKDILITGGDGLMSSDGQLEKIMDSIYQMAKKKRDANKKREDGQKFAEILRVRIGSRLLPYLPMRITDSLIKVLANFKNRAEKIGMKQFIIQTHFESPMEITPEVKTAVEKLNQAGWLITNQHVFTSAASRRGHNAKIRQVLNDIGILPYYSFSVKGYMENYFNFAPNARSVQEEIEEKIIGQIPSEYKDQISKFPEDTNNIVENIEKLKHDANLPFLSTDRNVINLPGVGKSLSYRVIGITRYGRRILEFDHDHTRRHSPIIEKMGRVIIVESKSISEYIKQLSEMGEDIREYDDIYGYSLNETEPRISIYEYPEYDYKVTEKITNLKID